MSAVKAGHGELSVRRAENHGPTTRSSTDAPAQQGGEFACRGSSPDQGVFLMSVMDGTVGADADRSHRIIDNRLTRS
jgi:hypothetical protein